jgi:[ribosomal protein S18]-alanine N-acetyltransferase
MHIDITAPPLSVHTATWRNMPSICKIEAQSFGAARILFGLWQRVGHPDVSTWIAHQGNSAAGYLIAYPRALGDEEIPYVAGVGVSPAFQRRGIGRELMLVSMEAYPRLWLHVRATNTAAIRMYESLKFTTQNRVHAFYQNGDDAIVMSSWR